MQPLLSVAIAQRINSPLLLDDIRSIERKITQAFAPAQATRIRGLRQRVLVGAAASTTVIATYQPPTPTITRPLLHGFIGLRAITVRYIDQAGTTSVRTIEVHYLHYSLPVWYALAWDHLRDAPRSFRIDRIQHIEPSNTSFKLRSLD